MSTYKAQFTKIMFYADLWQKLLNTNNTWGNWFPNLINNLDPLQNEHQNIYIFFSRLVFCPITKWKAMFLGNEGPKSIDPTMTKLTSPHLNKWGQMNALWVVVYLSHWGRDNLTTISQTIFSNAFCWMIIQISLKFIPKGPIDNMPALIQILAWRRMATSHYLNQWWPSLLTHICVTRP